uniref:Centromere protein X n=1 Tax=Haemonchus contortus TaxID=6289 RepID=A0A7I4YID0_HAECO
VQNMAPGNHVKESAVRSLITIGCRDNAKPKSIDPNAIRLLTALTNALTTETLFRAAQHARREGRSLVTLSDLQHTLPSIMLDFSA